MRSTNKKSGSRRKSSIVGYSSSRHMLTDEHKLDAKEAFDLFDENGSGLLDVAGTKMAMRALGLNPSKEENRHLVMTIDINGDGYINFDEFLQVIAPRLIRRNARKQALCSFNLFDTDNVGKITFENLREIADDLGEDVDNNVLDAMLDLATDGAESGVAMVDFLQIVENGDNV